MENPKSFPEKQAISSHQSSRHLRNKLYMKQFRRRLNDFSSNRATRITNMKGRVIVLSVLLVFCGAAACQLSCDGPIETTKGSVTGEELVSTHGTKFCAYRGVPYAKPPLGKLRFQPPRPMERWTNIFNATKDASMCPQRNFWFNDISYNEDCLALNIYTPWGSNKDRSRQRSKLPVLVYFHEGAFTAGEAGMRSKPPQRLMNKPIVLVMVQYRLGVFGFLSTGDSASSGNYGLLDQVFALQWVQQNIAAFGGDKTRVTIFGQSAGGGSVTYHMVSPMSRGLYRCVIAQSGAILSTWGVQRNPLRWTTQLGREIGCTSPNTTELVECCRNVSAKTIMDTIIRLGWDDDGMLPFSPVVENRANGRFITENPLKLFEEGKIYRVPLMAGTTKDDAAYMLWGNNTKYDNINDEFFNKTLPDELRLLTHYETNLLNMSYAVKREYFDRIDVSNRSQVLSTAVQMMTDVTFYAGTATTVRLVALQNLPVYMYLFAHAGNMSWSNFSGGNDVVHEMDLYYLFNRTELTAADEKFSNELIDMWYNFASQLNPTPRGFNGTKWTTSGTGKRLKYLEMGEEANTMKQQTDLMINRTSFWNEIAPVTDNPNA